MKWQGRIRPIRIRRGACAEATRNTYARWLWVVLICLGLWGSFVAPHAQAQSAAVHVSDEFRRVAREVARRYVTENLKKLCKNAEAGVPAERFCGAIVERLTELILVAAKKDADREMLGDAVEGFGRSLVRAGATLLLEDAIRKLTDLAATTPATGAKAMTSIGSLAPDLTTCMIENTMQPGKATPSCTKLDKAKPAPAVAPAAAGPKLLKKDSILPVVAMLQSHLDETGADKESPEYDVSVVLKLLSDVSNAFDKGAFAMASALAEHYDLSTGQLYRTEFVNEASLQAKLKQLKAGGCAGADPIVDKIEGWLTTRAGVAHKVGMAVASFNSEEVNKLLQQVPALDRAHGCPAGSEGAQVAEELRRNQISYVADARRAAIIGPLIGPVLTASLLVDYLRTRDKAELRAHATDATLYGLSAAIAATDTSQPAACEENGHGGVDCTEPDAQTSAAVSFSASVPADAELVVAMRYSPQSARNTCLYQALAGSMGRPIRAMPARGFCRPLRITDGVVGLFPELLKEHPGTNGRLYKWARPLVDPGGRLFTLRFTETERLQWADISALLEGVRGSLAKKDAPAGLQSLLALLEAGARWAEQLQNGSSEQAARPLLVEAATLIKPNVTSILERSLIKLDACSGKERFEKVRDKGRWEGMRCALRLLADASYDPLVQLIASDATPESRRHTVSTIYQNLVKLDPLNSTPLLVNVGLGATALLRPNTATEVNMTLLDKLGVAYRMGNRNQWEVGGFVGGFLDSVIRELSDSDQVQFWLIGGAFGVREFKKGLPLGLELHVAAGVPYNLKQFSDHISAACGLALIVPADIVFEE